MNAATVLIFDEPGAPFRLEQWPIPDELGEGGVLVEISLATICGSDLHTISGLRTEPTPAILGHEGVGRVLRTGHGASVQEGSRVTWTIADSCGRCPPCTDYELPQKCHALFKYGHASIRDGSGLNGCYASHILLRPGTRIVSVPDAVSDTLAAPANCALATMVNALSSPPIPCRAALIQGAGMLGLYAIALLRDRGVEAVFCVDVHPGRLALAEAFGAVPITVRVDDKAGEAQWQPILDAAPDGVDLVVEVAGVAALVPDGIRLLRPGGHYGFVGMVHPDTALPITGEAIVRKCMTVRGTHNYAPCHLEEAVAFLERTADEYPYESLVSRPYALTDLETALKVAKSQHWPRVAVKP